MEVSLTQMSLLNQRLTIWGEIVKAQNEGYELPTLREKWPQIGSTVVTALVSPKIPSRTSQGSRNDMV